MSMRSSNELALIISPSASPTNNSTSTSPPSFSGLPSSVSPFAVPALPPASPPASLSSPSNSNSWDVVLVSPEKEQIVLFNPEDRSLRVQRARSQSFSSFPQRLPPSLLHSSSTSSSAASSISSSASSASSSSSSSTKSSPTSLRSSVSSSTSTSSSLPHMCPVCLRSFSTSEMTTRYFALLQTLLPSSPSSPSSTSAPSFSSSSTPASESASNTSSSASSSASSASFPQGGDEASFRGLFNTGYFQRFFVEDRKIGSGGFGAVFQCRHILYGVDLGTYALKKVPIGTNQSWFNRVIREVKVLQGLHHPNIIGYRHTWLESHSPAGNFGPEVPCLFILMDFANAGNLADYLTLYNKRGRPRYLSEETLWRFFIDALLGLNHLHHLAVLHRDMKPQNLLLNMNIDPTTGLETTTLMISDFGQCEALSMLQNQRSESRTGATGTIEFMAPELHETDANEHYLYDHSVKSDIWSLGVILYAMAFSSSPFDEEEFEDALAKLLNFREITFPSHPSRPIEIRELISWMMKRNPTLRPTTDEILAFPFIKKVLRKLGRTWTGPPQTSTFTSNTASNMMMSSYVPRRPRSASSILTKPLLPPPLPLSSESLSSSSSSSSSASSSSSPLHHTPSPTRISSSSSLAPRIRKILRHYTQPMMDITRGSTFAVQILTCLKVTGAGGSQDSLQSLLFLLPVIIFGAFSMSSLGRSLDRRTQSLLQSAICGWISLLALFHSTFSSPLPPQDEQLPLPFSLLFFGRWWLPIVSSLLLWIFSLIIIFISTSFSHSSRPHSSAHSFSTSSTSSPSSSNNHHHHRAVQLPTSSQLLTSGSPTSTSTSASSSLFPEPQVFHPHQE